MPISRIAVFQYCRLRKIFAVKIVVFNIKPLYGGHIYCFVPYILKYIISYGDIAVNWLLGLL